MARPRKNITLDEQIERAQQEVFRIKDKYDAAIEGLNRLQKKKQEVRQKELLKAVEASNRSYEEIMRFLKGESDEDEE